MMVMMVGMPVMLVSMLLKRRDEIPKNKNLRIDMFRRILPFIYG